MLFIMFAYICRQYDFDAANIQKKIDKCKKNLPRLCNQAEVADPHGVQPLKNIIKVIRETRKESPAT